MSKNVLVITSSYRKGSNSEELANYFIKGAKDSGNQVEKVRLCEKHIKFCIGCLACQKTGKCVLKDDAAEIVNKMRKAEVIAFATPIYYYELSGQMKTLLDRSNPLFNTEYAFRDIYLLTAAAEDEQDTDATAIGGMNGWISCFEHAKLAGTVFAGGVESAGDIDGHPALVAAYNMGKAI